MTNEETAIGLKRVRAFTASGAARSVRKAARLSLGDVAEAINSNRSTVHRWETGQRRPHGDAALRYGSLIQRLMDET